MKIANVDLDEDILIVAEVGNNHEGSYGLAEELIGLATEAGAGAVKFQTFRTELFISRKEKERFAKLKSFELTFDQFERLSKTAHNMGLLFLSTPLDLESANFLSNIVPAFKIASADNTFYPLLQTIAGFGKPIIMSAGLADLSQMSYSKLFLESIWRNLGIYPGLCVLHCVTSYPVPPEEVNLSAISTLGQKLGCTVGYSDHALGIEAAVLSVGQGARIIEKHFTKDKNFSDFRDHALSADVAEMNELVRRVKDAATLLGCGEKTVQASEKESLQSVRRSIAAKRDLPEGTILAWHDITWTRPPGGLSPGQESLVLDKRLKRRMNQGEAIDPADLEDIAS